MHVIIVIIAIIIVKYVVVYLLRNDHRCVIMSLQVNDSCWAELWQVQK